MSTKVVRTVDELAALPEGTVIVAGGDDPRVSGRVLERRDNREGRGTPAYRGFNGGSYSIAGWGPSLLPATIIHSPS